MKTIIANWQIDEGQGHKHFKLKDLGCNNMDDWNSLEYEDNVLRLDALLAKLFAFMAII